VTDYFRALLLRHAAVSESRVGDPFGAAHLPVAAAPSAATAVAVDGHGSRPVGGRTTPPVADRAAGSAAPERPAVTAGLSHATPSRDLPSTADAAISVASLAGTPTARAPQIRPADAPPPVLAGAVNAEIAAPPRGVSPWIATRHALPRGANPDQAGLEGDRPAIRAAVPRDEIREPMQRDVVEAAWPAPWAQARPLPEVRGHDGSDTPPPSLGAGRERVGQEPAMPRLGGVPQQTAAAAMLAADPMTAGARAGSDGMRLPVPAMPPMPPPVAARDRLPAAPAASPETTLSVAGLAGRPQAAAAAVQASAAAEAALPLPLPPLPASPPQAGTDTPKIGIRVSIDRLDLRAATPVPVAAPARAAPPGRRVGLDDYAARRRASAPS
jgi:hypothetical protein